MSATATALVLLDENNVAIDCNIIATRTCRLGEDGAIPNTNLYFHLTDDQRIFVGKKPYGRVTQVSITSAFWEGAAFSTSGAMTGMEVYVIPAPESSVSFPVVYLFGGYEAQADSSAHFLAVLPMSSISLTENFYPDNILGFFPADHMTMWALSTFTSPEVWGYYGPSLPNQGYGMSLDFGWWSMRLAEAGQTGVYLDDHGSCPDGYVWYVESPASQPLFAPNAPAYRKYPARMSYMNIDTDPTSSSMRLLPFVVMKRDADMMACRLVSLSAEDVFSDTYSRIVSRELVAGAPSLSMPYGDPLSIYGSMPDGTLTAFLKGNEVTAVAIGWGLGTAYIEPTPETMIGGISVVLGGIGWVAVVGDGATYQTFSNPGGDTPWVDKIVCSYVGSLDDPFMFNSATDNLSRGKVVMVSGRYVYTSVTGADFDSLTPTLTIPSASMTSEEGKSALHYSVDVRFFEADHPAVSYIPAGWYVACTYQGADTWPTMGRVYYANAQATSWSIVADIDFSGLAESTYQTATGFPPSLVECFGQSTVGVPQISLITSSMILILVGMHCYSASGGHKYYECKMHLTSVEGDWLTSIQEVTSNRQGNYSHASQIGDFDYVAAPVISGDGQYVRLFYPEDASFTEMLGASSGGVFTATAFAAGTVQADNMVWQQYADTLFADGLSVDFVLPLYEGEGYKLFGVKNNPTTKQPLYYCLSDTTSSVVGDRLSVEAIGVYNPDTDVLSKADYRVAFTFTSPEHGTLTFLRGPSDEVAYVQFSDSATQATLNLPEVSTADRFDPARVFYSLGFAVSDTYEHTEVLGAEVVTTLYLVSTSGSIWSMSSTDAEFTLVSTPFSGLENVKLAKVDSVWVATFGKEATGVMTSPDLSSWTTVLLPGDGSGPLAERAVDIIPVGSGPCRTRVIDDAWTNPSIVAGPAA